MKRFASLVICVFISSFIVAQTEADALRYSMTQYGSTARSLSMGGAMGALGGDFSTLATNPAGIGVYKKSEFTLSPGLFSKTTKSNYLEQSETDTKYNFNFGNAGAVFSYDRGSTKLVRNWNFGIGYNRVMNYHDRSLFQAGNTRNSMLDYFASQANGTTPSNLGSSFPFESNLAYQTYLIDTNTFLFGDSSTYATVIPNAGALQRRSVTSKGAAGEVDFSLGGNIDEHLFFGFTLGLTSLRYVEEVTYEEIDDKDTIQDPNSGLDFKSFKLNQDLTTEGAGVNFKFGLIWKPIYWFRIGAAVHTPTYYYTMNDNYSSFMRANFANGSTYTYSSPIGEFEYKLTTPFKAIGSIAFVLAEHGLITGEYEMIDYSDARLNSVSYKFFDENQAIKDKFSIAHNFKIGTEWRYLNYTIRGGFAQYGSPFKTKLNDVQYDMNRQVISGGLGFRTEDYFVDLGYAHTQSGSFFRPYSLANELVEGAFFDSRSNNFVLTFGARF